MKIAIIGCGFAGLSAALLLSKKSKDNEITLYDKFTEVKMVGAGIMLQQSSIIALQELGLYDYVLQQGEKIDVLNGINHKKKQVFSTKHSDYHSESFSIGICRCVVFDALYDACKQKNNISFVLGHPIDELETLSKTYDLVIVANGSHSSLRSLLPIKQHYALYPYGCAWTMIPDDTTSNNALLQYVYRSKEMFGLLPSGKKDGRRMLSVFWSLPITQKDIYSKEDMILRMSQYHNDPIIIDKIKAANFDFAVYADVWMEKFNYKNIVVIGDAAHGMSPQLGQGANMAFIDAYVLYKTINKYNLIASLEKYSQQRIKHIRFYAQASKFLTPLFQSECDMYGIMRDWMFTISQKVPFTRKLSINILVGKKLNWWSSKEIDLAKL